MTSLSDFVQLLGYLFLFGAILVLVYYLLPAQAPGEAPRAAPAPRKGGTKPHRAIDMADLIAQSDAHERYVPGHAGRVARLASALAGAAGLPAELRARIHQAGLLHDIGMMEVPAELLARSSVLPQADMGPIWRHPVRGAAKALELTKDPELAGWVRASHERWDGLGYPDGLAGEEIPLPARILRIADSAEAMLQDRPYRPALIPDEVSAELIRFSGVMYDPHLVPLFVDYVLPHYLLQEVSSSVRSDLPS
ncbi:MAG: HD domain-containing phosphohydrolase [Candidatus Sericytochromatia bacterium]|nr:HD domain-containing phosphohydrolase [Candidatus Sericytochromatia bacterium]